MYLSFPYVDYYRPGRLASKKKKQRACVLTGHNKQYSPVAAAGGKKKATTLARQQLASANTFSGWKCNCVREFVIIQS